MDFIDGGPLVMSLSEKAMAFAGAVLCGAVLFLATLLAAVRGAGEHLGHLAVVYPGYHVSYLGSLVGLAYGLVTGAVLGALLAWLYNRFVPAAK
jgi:hypothetical protein